MDPVLPPPAAEMHAAAQHLGLETRLAMEGDDPSFGDGTLTDHSFSTMPTRLLAMYRRPVSSQSNMTPTTRPTIHRMPDGRSARAATTGEIPDESNHGRNVATSTNSGDPTTQLLR